MIRVRWLGHACFLIEHKGLRIIIDPWISGNPACPLKISEVPKVDHIVVTHDHGDHLGDAIELAKRDGAKFIGIYELAEWAREQGVEHAVGANIGGWFTVDGVRYMLTPALHSCARGAPTGVLIDLDGAIVYHAGDTGLFAEMALLGSLNKIKLALLPIGGHFTMGPREAAHAVCMLNPEHVIPMHYNTFPVIQQDPEAFRELVRRLRPDVKVHVLRPGEHIDIG